MDLDTLFNDREKLVAVLNDESDIGCILVTVSFLDKCLMLLLKETFIKSSKTAKDILEPDGLLGEYSSKTKLSYCLSLIDKKKYSDLNKIAEIRNLFAHSHILLTFDDSTIQEKCNELKGWEDSLPEGYFDTVYQEPNVIARLKFTHTASNIINDLIAHGYLKRTFK